MSQILTPRQAEELHKAIIAYLSSSGLPSTAAALRQELNIGDTFDDATSKKYEGLLEKKWTSVVRLQKKIMELETRVASLQPLGLAAPRPGPPHSSVAPRTRHMRCLSPCLLVSRLWI
ncbi:Nuclear distribution protein PAC1 like [Verticillium longisporum]|nr:Nuclear distribution protein PAC1 like [Verticillium longisporum]